MTLRREQRLATCPRTNHTWKSRDNFATELLGGGGTIGVRTNNPKEGTGWNQTWGYPEVPPREDYETAALPLSYAGASDSIAEATRPLQCVRCCALERRERERNGHACSGNGGRPTPRVLSPSATPAHESNGSGCTMPQATHRLSWLSRTFIRNATICPQRGRRDTGALVSRGCCPLTHRATSTTKSPGSKCHVSNKQDQVRAFAGQSGPRLHGR